MLSAVAARKARLQAQQPPHTLLQPLSLAQSISKPPSKRKLTTEPARKKKRKANKRHVLQQSRDFEQDTFAEQADIVVVDDGSSDDDQTGCSSDGEISRDVAFAKPGWVPSTPLRYSSDSDSREEPATRKIGTTGTPTVPPQALSTWRPVANQTMFALTADDARIFKAASVASARLCLLRKGERLTLLGVYSLLVVYGSITLGGTLLSPHTGTQSVFAPWSSPLPAVECIASRESSCGIPPEIPSHLQRAFTGADAAVVIQELRTGIEGLGRVCRTFENVFSFPGGLAADDLGLNGVQYVEVETSTVCPLVVPPSWDRACKATLGENKDSSRMVCLVQGAKKTGKSSFARMLTNSLLAKYRKVAFLECDVGQSEFTPGGVVALNIIDSPVFGPPFSHPSIPYRAHYIGSTSPRDSPDLYLEAVGALIQTYNIDVQYGDIHGSHPSDTRMADSIPLVINTMGWNKGLGADLSRKIIEIVQPSNIYDVSAVSPDDEWGNFQEVGKTQVPSGHAQCRIHALKSSSPTGSSTRFTPADHRNLSLLSYFHVVFPPNLHPKDALASLYADSWDTSLPLCAQVPYEVNVKAAFDAIVLVGPGAEDVVPSELARVLNGSIVGLISQECDSSNVSSGESEGAVVGLSYAQGAPPPSPTASSCIALALLRSIQDDATDGWKFHVLTPICPVALARASPRVLLKGSMELPVWGLLDYRDHSVIGGIERQQVPYLRWGKGEGAGAERRRARRNLTRFGLY
ncbi:hypothetical protein BC835DRAFT_1414719 [Cytidiella melzeri]|nr:hypothetical protein BC835DRAFT_1414719 [Cytidiella melzeri]